jgi:hypothetical protein
VCSLKISPAVVFGRGFFSFIGSSSVWIAPECVLLLGGRQPTFVVGLLRHDPSSANTGCGVGDNGAFLLPFYFDCDIICNYEFVI